jgi:hypothetical protein
VIANDARCTREIESRITMEKAAYNKKADFTRKLDLNLRKKQVKSHIWGIAVYDAESWE